MKSKVNGFIIFLMGAVFGTAFTRTYFKTVYEKQANEEIASVKERFSNAQKSDKVNDEEPLRKATFIIGDSSYSDNTEDKSASTETEENSPYIITPDEFGEKDGYSLISLTYYADGILADDENYIIENMKENVGFDWINYFGNYEDDAIFVRNDEKECDYEILFDRRDYTDVVRSGNNYKEDD